MARKARTRSQVDEDTQAEDMEIEDGEEDETGTDSDPYPRTFSGPFDNPFGNLEVFSMKSALDPAAYAMGTTYVGASFSTGLAMLNAVAAQQTGTTNQMVLGAEAARQILCGCNGTAPVTGDNAVRNKLVDQMIGRLLDQALANVKTTVNVDMGN